MTKRDTLIAELEKRLAPKTAVESLFTINFVVFYQNNATAQIPRKEQRLSPGGDRIYTYLCWRCQKM
jgi:hypothetical protein